MLGLYGEFQASLGYRMRPCLKQTGTQTAGVGDIAHCSNRPECAGMNETERENELRTLYGKKSQLPALGSGLPSGWQRVKKLQPR